MFENFKKSKNLKSTSGNYRSNFCRNLSTCVVNVLYMYYILCNIPNCPFVL